MSFKLRWAMLLACIGVLGAVLLLLSQSHASARSPMSYGRLNAIQKRIVSETLASALSPSATTRAPTRDEGGGPDGAPFTPPKSFDSPGATGSPANYFPASSGGCSVSRGSNVKVNQNCLNVTDPD